MTDALVAAGGNSRAARKARAALQWRDRFGRWVEMGRGVKFKVRRGNGSVVSVIGKFVGATNDANFGQVHVVNDPNGLRDGFYEVGSSNAQEIIASLTPTQLAKRGIEMGKDEKGNLVGERTASDIQNESTIRRSDAPLGWDYDGEKYVSEGFEVTETPADSDGPGKFKLTRNGEDAGDFDDWSEILSEVDRQDEGAPATGIGQAVDDAQKNDAGAYDFETGKVSRTGFLVFSDDSKESVPADDFWASKVPLAMYIADHTEEFSSGSKRLGIKWNKDTNTVDLSTVDHVATVDEARSIASTKTNGSVFDAERGVFDDGSDTNNDNPDAGEPVGDDAGADSGLGDPALREDQGVEQPSTGEPADSTDSGAGAPVPDTRPEDSDPAASGGDPAEDAGGLTPEPELDALGEEIPQNLEGLRARARSLDRRADRIPADSPIFDRVMDAHRDIHDRLTAAEEKALAPDTAPDPVATTPAPEPSVPSAPEPDVIPAVEDNTDTPAPAFAPEDKVNWRGAGDKLRSGTIVSVRDDGNYVVKEDRPRKGAPERATLPADRAFRPGEEVGHPSMPESPATGWAADPIRPTPDEITNAPVGAVVSLSRRGGLKAYKGEDGNWHEDDEANGTISVGDLRTQASLKALKGVEPEIARIPDEVDVDTLTPESLDAFIEGAWGAGVSSDDERAFWDSGAEPDPAFEGRATTPDRVIRAEDAPTPDPEISRLQEEIDSLERTIDIVSGPSVPDGKIGSRVEDSPEREARRDTAVADLRARLDAARARLAEVPAPADTTPAPAVPDAPGAAPEAGGVTKGFDEVHAALVERNGDDVPGLTRVGEAMGSNPGGLYEAPDGTQYYMKTPATEDHVKNEVLASALYRALGLDAAEVYQTTNENGDQSVISKIIPGSKNLFGDLADPEYKRAIQRGFAVDAWLANWDVAGGAYDNIIKDENGNPVRIDQGGSLRYRARGGLKPSFDGNPGELDTFLDADLNPVSANVYGGMTDADRRESAAQLANISDEQIDQLVADSGADAAIGDILKARRDAILARFDLLPDDSATETPAAPVADTEETVIPAEAPAEVVPDVAPFTSDEGEPLDNADIVDITDTGTDDPTSDVDPDELPTTPGTIDTLADYADSKFPPTEEQLNIINAVLSGQDVAVQALAGTGKTSTLELIARRMGVRFPDKKIIYVAFNKSVEVEANRRMPGNVESRTGDSIAWTGISKTLTSKMSKTDRIYLPSAQAAHFGFMPIRTDEETIDTVDVARGIDKVIKNFTISEDDNISAKHFLDSGIPFSFTAQGWAEQWWNDINDPKGVLPFRNDHATKIWALGRPDLSNTSSGVRTPADLIFFDEAQDINPVMAKVIRDQDIQKIYVGDGRQAIYGFRGAENELDKVETDVVLPLTKSWRFGPEVAGMGNRFLSLLKSDYKVIGGGGAGEVMEPGTMRDADAVLTRSNGGAITAILQELENGRTVGVAKKTKDELQSWVDTVRFLKEGGKRGKKNEDLAGYTSWDQVEQDINEDKATRKVEMIYKLVEKHGIDGLQDAINNTVAVRESEASEGPLDMSDGAKGSLLEGVNYAVTTDSRGLRISLSGRSTFVNKELIAASGFRWDRASKQWFRVSSDPSDLSKAADKVRGTESAPKVDVVVTTAHKAKGLEWDNVRIANDFWGPRVKVDPETGETTTEFPAPEELRLAYVAVTRAAKRLDPGALAWVLNYTDDEDENPDTPSKGLPGESDALPDSAPTPEPDVAETPAPAVEDAPAAAPEPIRPPALIKPTGWEEIDFDSPYDETSSEISVSDLASVLDADDLDSILSDGIRSRTRATTMIDGEMRRIDPRLAYEAISEKGESDPRRIVAEEYDRGLGGTENVRALNDFYRNNPDLDPLPEGTDISEELIDMSPRTFADLLDHIVSPDTPYAMDPAHYEPVGTGVPGTSDDPKEIATIFDSEDLTELYRELVSDGSGETRLTFGDTRDAPTATVPVEAIRDALELNGKDTDKLAEDAITPPEPLADWEVALLRSGSAWDAPAPADRLARARHLYAVREHPEGDETFGEILSSDSPNRRDVESIIDRLSRRPYKDIPTPVLVVSTPEPASTDTDIPDLDDPEGLDITDPGLILDAIQSRWAGRARANGDVTISSRDYTDARGNRFRYETNVTRTDNEFFYVYVRETNLSTGEVRSMRTGPMVQSAKALNNRVKVANAQINKSNPRSWFNGKGNRPRVKVDELNTATGEHEHLRDQAIRPETLTAIRNAVDNEALTDAIVRSIFESITRNGASEDVLNRLRTSTGLSRAQVNDVVDAINTHVIEEDRVRAFQTWVSADGRTPLFEGDIIQHADGRMAKISRRIIDHSTKGYDYSDYIFVKFAQPDGTYGGKTTNVTSRSFTLVRTADGTDGTERVGSGAIELPAPELSTRAKGRIARRAEEREADRAKSTPPTTVPISRKVPERPTVTIDGKDYGVSVSRHSTIAGRDIEAVETTVRDIREGDMYRTLDRDGNPILGEVVGREAFESGFTLTFSVPRTFDEAEISKTYYHDSDSDSVFDEGGTATTVYRPKETGDDAEVITEADRNRMGDAYYEYDTSVLTEEEHKEVVSVLYGAMIPKARHDELLRKLSKGGRRVEVADEKLSPEEAARIARAIADDSGDPSDIAAADAAESRLGVSAPPAPAPDAVPFDIPAPEPADDNTEALSYVKPMLGLVDRENRISSIVDLDSLSSVKLDQIMDELMAATAGRRQLTPGQANAIIDGLDLRPKASGLAAERIQRITPERRAQVVDWVRKNLSYSAWRGYPSGMTFTGGSSYHRSSPEVTSGKAAGFSELELAIGVIEATIDRASEENNFDADAVRTAVSEVLADYVKDRTPVIRINQGPLLGVLTDGRFKSQFETRSSGGSLDPEMRGARENAWFGTPTDEKVDRAIYGYLDDDLSEGFDGASHYGDIKVVLKEATRDRITFTMGDSLGLDAFPTPLTAPDHMALESEDIKDALTTTANPGRLKAAIETKISKLWHSYTEMQVHGGVSVDDIEQIIFFRKPPAALQAKMESLGVKWKVG